MPPNRLAQGQRTISGLSDAELYVRIAGAEQQMQLLAAAMGQHPAPPHGLHASHQRGVEALPLPQLQDLRNQLPQLQDIRNQQGRGQQEHEDALAAIQADAADFLDACRQNSDRMAENAAGFKLAVLRHQEQATATLHVQSRVVTQVVQEQQRTSGSSWYGPVTAAARYLKCLAGAEMCTSGISLAASPTSSAQDQDGHFVVQLALRGELCDVIRLFQAYLPAQIGAPAAGGATSGSGELC